MRSSHLDAIEQPSWLENSDYAAFIEEIDVLYS